MLIMPFIVASCLHGTCFPAYFCPACHLFIFLFCSVTNGCQGVMLTMPFTVAVYMVRGFLQAHGQQQQQGAAASGSGDSLAGGGAFAGAAAAAGVDEQLVGQLTGALVSRLCCFVGACVSCRLVASL
jgi:hypothetical protein